MEKNYSSTDRPAAFDQALSLPHFDDEATLLSARPVVPINQIAADRPTKRRRMVFGLTILAATLVGAVSAMLLMQSGRNSQNAAEPKVNQPIVSSTGAAGGSTSEPAQTRVPVARALDEPAQIGEEPNALDSSMKKRQTAAVLRTSIKPTVSRNSTRPAKADRPDYERAEDFENDEIEQRRAERRDARREARRQNRERREQKIDDLLRIREIFEGSPRP
jgi:hypothetical protein